MVSRSNMVPSSTVKHEKYEKHDIFDIMSPLPHKPKSKRSGENRQPDLRIEDYEQWMAIVMTAEGRPMIKASTDMKPYRGEIMEPEAFEKFRHITTDFIGHAKRGKPRKSSTQADNTRQLQPYSRKVAKRRHATTLEDATKLCPQVSEYANRPPSNPGQTPPRPSKIALCVSDWPAQRQWFDDAFRSVQQVGCRTIAKVWIKKIHPKKQSTHPYNGNVPRDPFPPDANRTKPPYWPVDVKHKEPDHIDRAARTKLLVHLIIHTPQRQIKPAADEAVYIYAQDLLAALEEKKTDFKPERWAIVQEIISVRQRLEAMQDPNEYCDPGATIPVTDYSAEAKAKNGQNSGVKDEDEEDDDEDEEGQKISTPASGQSPSSSDDPVGQIAQANTRLGQDRAACSGTWDVPSSEDFLGVTDDHTAPAMDLQHYRPMSSAQPHPALMVDTSIPHGLMPSSRFDPRIVRMGNVPAGYGKPAVYNPPRHRHPHRQPLSAQDIMTMQDWATATDSASTNPGHDTSPTDFLPVEYTYNGTQCQTSIPHQTFRMAEAVGMVPESPMDLMGMGTPSGSVPTPMSMGGPGQFHASPYMEMGHHPMMSRPIPTRTMSSATAAAWSDHQRQHQQQQVAMAAADEGMFLGS